MALNIVERIDNFVPVRHVLVSVSNKEGLDQFLPELLAINEGALLYSTGGTYERIREILGEERAGTNLVAVSDYTGQPEMQGGLVKTLDFKIYLGLLGETYNDAHNADLTRVGGVAFDMVVVNLYPFRETVEQSGCTPEKARANIDIGGPCMVRAAAKNFLRVASVTSPADYAGILEEMRDANGRLSVCTRFELACKAFAHTAEYDSAIAAYFTERDFDDVQKCYGCER